MANFYRTPRAGDYCRPVAEPDYRPILNVVRGFLVLFWLINLFVLISDFQENHHDMVKCSFGCPSDLNTTEPYDPIKNLTTIKGPNPVVMQINLVVLVSLTFLTLCGLILIWFQDFALSASLAAFWTILVATEFFTNEIYAKPGLIKYHYLVNFILIPLLWLFAAIVRRHDPVEATISNHHHYGHDGQTKPLAEKQPLYSFNEEDMFNLWTNRRVLISKQLIKVMCLLPSIDVTLFEQTLKFYDFSL